ncbi:MAG: sodium:proton antiporter NhaD [Bacteroidia bacterium]|nr:sodium:proton antiporter NhaD [Bacteroidia bacterium]
MLLILVFIIGYLAIIFEHTIKLNKTASAILTGVLCWTVYMLSGHNNTEVNTELSLHLSSISEILFFLLGAMTIVELIDAHKGFTIITDKIQTQSTIKLIWIIGILSFFLSAVLDSLASAIVMITLLRKIISGTEQRKIYAGLVVIAVNSSAWSVIGPVTTTMLWIGKQITPFNTATTLILPSLAGLTAAMLYFSFILRNETLQSQSYHSHQSRTEADKSLVMLITGVAALLFVPVFKTLTHLPPYIGMMLSLGLVWIVSEIIHKDKDTEEKKNYSVAHALTKIDTPSILFFLGILLAVGSLEVTGHLHHLAEWMRTTIVNLDLVAIAIGLTSAIVDNVPLVAASQGMFDSATYPTDDHLWQLINYCAATGGSILIIGSAAGVAVMGMEHITFGWYMKKITIPATIAYFSGILMYLLIT